VVVANDGVEAVGAFQKEPFDVVLMDIQMPRMDVFEATATIRRKEVDWGVRTPSIALTADTTKGYRQKVMAAEMDGYVPKPLNIADLLNEIRASVRCGALRPVRGAAWCESDLVVLSFNHAGLTDGGRLQSFVLHFIGGTTGAATAEG